MSGGGERRRWWTSGVVNVWFYTGGGERLGWWTSGWWFTTGERLTIAAVYNRPTLPPRPILLYSCVKSVSEHIFLRLNAHPKNHKKLTVRLGGGVESTHRVLTVKYCFFYDFPLWLFNFFFCTSRVDLLSLITCWFVTWISSSTEEHAMIHVTKFWRGKWFGDPNLFLKCFMKKTSHFRNYLVYSKAFMLWYWKSL